MLIILACGGWQTKSNIEKHIIVLCICDMMIWDVSVMVIVNLTVMVNIICICISYTNWGNAGS